MATTTQKIIDKETDRIEESGEKAFNSFIGTGQVGEGRSFWFYMTSLA